MKNNFTMECPHRKKAERNGFFVRRGLISLVYCMALMLATTAHAQQATYDADYHDRTVLSVLDDLRTRTGFLFIHKDGDIPENDRVTVSLSGATLNQILDKVLVEKGYRYRIDGKDIIITRAAAPSARPQTVTGTVTDEQGRPMPGVSVIIRGELRGTATGSDGRFTLELLPGQVLDFSFVGMVPSSVVYNSQTNINVKMQELATEISTAVVIGYGSARKLGSIVGSVSKVNNDVLKSAPVANFADALQGQVAGMSVLSPSGEPSAMPSIRLRGINTMTAGNAPLYILDGSPVTYIVFSSVNPNDIENVVVLKDASSTAIYGSRAANGVIVMTTKKGRMNEDASVNISASYGISQVATDKVTMMNSGQYFTFREMLDPSLSGQEDWNRHKNIVLENGISTDWAKYIYRDHAPTYNLDASITGGGEKVSYYISLGHNTQQGIAPTSESHRTSVRSNIDANVKKWLKVGLSSNMSYNKFNQNPDVGGTSSNNPAAFARFARPDDSPNYYTVDNDGRVVYGERAEYLHQSKMWNPLYWEEIRDRNRKTASVMMNLYQEVRPVNGLVIRAVQSLDAFDYTYSSRVPPVESWVTPMGDPVTVNNGEGQAAETFQRFHNFTFTNTAEYKLVSDEKNTTTFLVGQESITARDKSYGVTFTGLTDKRLMLLSNSTDYIPPSHSITDRVYNSAFVRIDHNYDNKYYIDASYRVDGSSRFSKKNRWSEFFSVGGKWEIAKEEFFADNRWVNELGLRVSYGTTGNSQIQDYLYYGLIGGNNYVYEGESATTNIRAANDKLTWEKVATFNTGIDFRLWDRLYGSVDFYRKKTSDMLMGIPYSFTTGYSGGIGNVAAMTNTGLDFVVGLDVLETQDFFWRIQVNANYNKNKITELFNGIDEYVIPETGLKMQVGKPYGEYFIVRRHSVDPRDGRQIWLDKYGNQTKEYSEEHAVFVGKQRYAPFSGGFGTFARYKNFSLNADFTFALGKWAINNDKYFFENAFNYGSFYNQSVSMLNMWTTPGQVTDIPAATEQIYPDDHILENASFLRMKRLQLNYSLPQRWMTKSNFFRRVNVYVLARNLFTVTKFSGFDPEPDSNVILFSYPNTRQFVAGIEINF